MEENRGKIVFTNNNNKVKVKGIAKTFLIIFIASLSGAVISNYMIVSKLKDFGLYNYVLDKSNDKYIIADVVKKVEDSVVGIKVTKHNGEISKGTGAIYSSDGYIITNDQLVQNTSDITVVLDNEKQYRAEVVGADSNCDIAVVKIDGNNFETAKFGNGSKLQVGEVVISMLDYDKNVYSKKVSTGIICGLDKKKMNNNSKNQSDYGLIQTDTDLGMINAGGILFNLEGEIIGINSTKIKKEKEEHTFETSININEALKTVHSIIEYRDISKAEIGIYGEAISGNDQEFKGIYILEVSRGSSAYDSGMRPTDILFEIDGANIDNMETLVENLNKYNNKDTIICKVLRNGRVKVLKLDIEKQKH